jgi:hypothetical protein
MGLCQNQAASLFWGVGVFLGAGRTSPNDAAIMGRGLRPDDEATTAPALPHAATALARAASKGRLPPNLEMVACETL